MTREARQTQKRLDKPRFDFWDWVCDKIIGAVVLLYFLVFFWLMMINGAR